VGPGVDHEKTLDPRAALENSPRESAGPDADLSHHSDVSDLDRPSPEIDPRRRSGQRRWVGRRRPERINRKFDACAHPLMEPQRIGAINLPKRMAQVLLALLRAP
jgi:hypothetical protein